MYVGVLGPLVLTSGGGEVPVPVPGRMDRAVLARLALAESRAVSVDSLVEMLWPDGPPDSARNALQVKVSRLRALLGPDAGRLGHTDAGYRLVLAPDETDAGRFHALCAQGRAALADGRPADAVGHLRQALALWRGEPLDGLADDPRVAAARLRLAEARLEARELHAQALTASPSTTGQAIAELRELLHEEPLRPRARLLLMAALEASGRRAEALAVYDAGRRLLAEAHGLEPPAELRTAFDAMLEAERASARRATGSSTPIGRAAPANLLQTGHWLADQGDVEGAFRLAIAGAWWWWIGGKRHAGHDLLEGLLGTPGGPGVDDTLWLRADAWAGALRLDYDEPGDAFGRTENALERLGRREWNERDALAAVLVAERLYERGAHLRADALTGAARTAFARAGSEWGLGLTRAVEARGWLLRGDVATAQRMAGEELARFRASGDDAGTVFCLDVLGYAAEVRGRLQDAAALHRGALQTARHVGSPDWESRQLTRLGNVGVLMKRSGEERLLGEAARLAESLGSRSAEALARNGLGTALALSGDRAGADGQHRLALDWYERWGSDAGVAYTTARLGMLHAGADTGDSGDGAAVGWSRRSVALAVRTKDPRAVAFGLEAVALSAPDPRAAARALGAARALRARVGAPLPDAEAAGLRVRERWLAASLRGALAPEMRRAAADPDAVAAEWPAAAG